MTTSSRSTQNRAGMSPWARRMKLPLLQLAWSMAGGMFVLVGNLLPWYEHRTYFDAAYMDGYSLWGVRGMDLGQFAVTWFLAGTIALQVFGTKVNTWVWISIGILSGIFLVGGTWQPATPMMVALAEAYFPVAWIRFVFMPILPASLILCWVVMVPSRRRSAVQKALTVAVGLVVVVLAIGAFTWLTNLLLLSRPLELKFQYIGAGVPLVIVGSGLLLFQQQYQARVESK